jgi:molecular chaperone HscC
MIHVSVLQGESRFAMNNVLLGDLDIPVPIGPEGKEAADITFTYDVNSILEVIVKIVSTKVTKRIVIKNEENDMTDEEIDERLEALAELKIPPREQEENKLLLFRGDRMYEEAVGDMRRIIEEQLNEFEKALDRQDTLEISAARTTLKEFLDSVEDMDEE